MLRASSGHIATEHSHEIAHMGSRWACGCQQTRYRGPRGTVASM